jgi:outer membrane protein TolC
LYKLEQLKVEERWKREKLKPVVDLEYNALVQPFGTNQLNAFNANNYKWGATVYFPLFLRKERGDLRLTQLKIEANQLDLEQKVRGIRNKEEAFRNELVQMYQQLEIQRSQVVFAQQLRNAEQTRFDIGESSLFLVNTREVSYLSAQLKLAALEAKVKMLEAKWFWLASELD